MTFSALAGLAAGVVHVLAGPDHLAAVAPLAVNRPALPALPALSERSESKGSERSESNGSERSESKGEPQWRTGLQWGLGHTAGVVLIGVLLLTFRNVLPIDAISIYSERVVGIALVAVGLWALNRARQPHTHVHGCRLPADGFQLPVAGGRRPAAGRRLGWASFGMGALHGVAGSSHLFGILPALALPTQTDAVSYLAGFGAGAILAMTAFAGVVGMLTARAGQRGLVTHSGVLYACSISALLVGSFWLVS